MNTCNTTLATGQVDLEDLPLSPAIGAINEALLAYTTAIGSPGHVAASARQWHHASTT